MKFIGVMSLAQYREQVRKLFEKHGIHIYSELEIVGHTAETIKQYGWWSFDKDLPMYSTMFFAIVGKDKSEKIMQEIKDLSFNSEFEALHPPRAFQIAVEKMI
ncbi:MAG: hypothetical protein ACE5HS_21955 [bacterium]